MKRENILFLYAVVACAVLFFVEQVFVLPYPIKSVLKIVLFLAIPLVWTRQWWVKRGEIKLSAIVGGISFLGVLLGYWILPLDPMKLSSELATIGVDAGNFIFVGLYIIFINSLLEEHFFRGTLFLTAPSWKRGIASASLFAIYHIAIIGSWFTPLQIALSLITLFGIGIIFNELDERAKSILPSWTAHMAADLAVILIGMRLLGVS